jgi:hypothetical protein
MATPGSAACTCHMQSCAIGSQLLFCVAYLAVAWMVCKGKVCQRQHVCCRALLVPCFPHMQTVDAQQHSTAQHSTAQHSTAQHSAAAAWCSQSASCTFDTWVYSPALTRLTPWGPCWPQSCRLSRTAQTSASDRLRCCPRPGSLALAGATQRNEGTFQHGQRCTC